MINGTLENFSWNIQVGTNLVGYSFTTEKQILEVLGSNSNKFVSLQALKIH